MKATVIIGSASVGGFTEQLTAQVIEGMGTGTETAIFRPYMMDIGHCTDCGRCKGGDCVLRDDMDLIYASFEASDILLISTPVHFNSPSSVCKLAVDRFQKYWYSQLPSAGHKLLAMVSPGGGPRPRFENLASAGKSLAATIGAEWGGHHTLSFTDTMESLSEEQRAEARDFGKGLALRTAALLEGRR
ncbi:MAG: NAD(P)H-dependent oxidoreductase [Candidatus Methanomethylophilaceae archaeon]|jgi:multimeric flavodoxin WrbA|nr:NAD(P)H-dependent oxidoreductase [Candidatus Methanomethylophilaceae archaeon]